MYQTSWQYSDGGPLMVPMNTWGMKKGTSLFISIMIQDRTIVTMEC